MSSYRGRGMSQKYMWDWRVRASILNVSSGVLLIKSFALQTAAWINASIYFSRFHRYKYTGAMFHIVGLSTTASACP